ncbi:MAG: hypothetical protein ABI091_23395 [Ferruginibacter sp.]
MNKLPDEVLKMIHIEGYDRFKKAVEGVLRQDSFEDGATWALQSPEVINAAGLIDKAWYEGAMAKADEFSGIIKRLEDADAKTVGELRDAQKEIAEFKASIAGYKAFLKPLEDAYNEETEPI